MVSFTLCGALIAFVIFVAAQALCTAGVVSVDSRNLCLTVFAVWLVAACVTYSVGLLLMAGGLVMLTVMTGGLSC